jgi:hypothetical protein
MNKLNSELVAQIQTDQIQSQNLPQEASCIVGIGSDEDIC